MIISASRRTDIPAFYSDWFFQRLREGYVLVRNPMRPRQVARVSLSRDVVDGLVLWSKNPAPMLDRLSLLADYPYYFQYTLTSYGQDVETAVPPKGTHGLPTFWRLADAIGPHRVIWRYDPILINARYSAGYHIDAFARLAARLKGYTERCVIGFIEPYKNTKRHAGHLALAPLSDETMRHIARAIAEIATGNGIAVSACCEALDLAPCGIVPACCVDGALLARIGSQALRARKDKNQRGLCHCAESIDIGAYNCCPNGCLYCYANYMEPVIAQSLAAHNPLSPLLIGGLGPEDQVYTRAIASFAAPK